MSYDINLWNNYTVDNEATLNNKLSEFIYHVTIALGAKRVLEVGCNVGNNLHAFPNTFDVTGIDLNEYALNKAKKNHPTFNFRKGSITEIPFENNSFDLVFTRGVLIHIKSADLKKSMIELIRVSKKWIFNMEYFGKDEKEINWKRASGSLWYRNMSKRWSDFAVSMISDTDIPLEIDSAKVRFTLVRKQNSYSNESQ